MKVVVFKEGTSWVAQGVDEAVTASGASVELALHGLQVTLADKRVRTEYMPFAVVSPSPTTYDYMWSIGKPVVCTVAQLAYEGRLVHVPLLDVRVV